MPSEARFAVYLPPFGIARPHSAERAMGGRYVKFYKNGGPRAEGGHPLFPLRGSMAMPISPIVQIGVGDVIIAYSSISSNTPLPLGWTARILTQ